MKGLKKSISILLMLVMAVSMCFTAYADDEETTDTGSITIVDAVADQTYTAYKVFDLTYSTDSSGETVVAYSYTKSSDSDTLYTALTGSGSPFTLTATGVSGVYIVSVDEEKYSTNDIVTFLAELDQDLLTKSEAKTAEEDGELVISGLEYGYYYVTSTLGSVVMLTSTTPNATIYEKNDIEFEKEANDISVELGQVVNFTITTEIPDWTSFSKYTYTISDTMSEGLTFTSDNMTSMEITLTTGGTDGNGDAETVTLKVASMADSDGSYNVTLNNVTVGTLTYSEATSESTDENGNTTTATGGGFTLSLEVMTLGEEYIWETLTLSYSATVNEKAVASIEWNNAKLEYSNDPTDSSETDTKTDREYVYSAQIKIYKYDGSDDDDSDTESERTPLADAQFVLYKYVKVDSDAEFDSSVAYYTCSTDENGTTTYTESTSTRFEDGTTYYTIQYYVYTAATDTSDASISWVDSLENATVMTTNENGCTSFDGLEDGTYYLLETVAPNGYNLLTAPIEVVIDGDAAVDEDSTEVGTVVYTDESDESTTVYASNLSITEEIANVSGTLLPETGGMGRILLYVIGIALVLGAGCALIVRKRKSSVNG